MTCSTQVEASFTGPVLYWFKLVLQDVFGTG